jgi:hypothetical protein
MLLEQLVHRQVTAAGGGFAAEDRGERAIHGTLEITPSACS